MERLPSAAGGLRLEEHAAGFVAELSRLGYSPRTCEAQVALLRHLARWLVERGVPLSELSGEVVGEYVAARRGRSQLRSGRALEPLLGYLRGLGAVPPAVVAVPEAPVDVLLARFGQWLSGERGLAPATVSSYLCQARPFATACAGQLPALTAARVADLVTGQAVGFRPRSAQVRANAVRALLRFLWLEGMTAVPLAGAVGSFAAPAGAAVPRGLSPDQAGDLLTVVRAGPGGLRNEPMVALMLRLALRASEVAALLLDDVDWRRGAVTVRGKGARVDEVPLPVDVGTPLVRYLRDGRPAGTARRQVFLALDAPHGPLTGPAVASVAGRALRAAGISEHGGAHLLRHAVACGVLAAGGGLVEAGGLLRHAGPQVTAVYARADLAALRRLARPWPGGADA
jgi:site-specific recombinase XerD